MKNTSNYLLLLLTVFILTACGAGGEGDDTTPPEVTSTSPANDATGVSLDTILTATFSEEVDSAAIVSANFSFVDNDGNSVSGTLGYDVATRTASFTPDSDLKESTTYTATIKAVIADSAGNNMEADFSWSFTTKHILPTVLSVSPNADSSDISLSSAVTATFSEAMDESTITNSSFTLVDTSNNSVSGTINYNAGTKTATLTPTEELVESTTYTSTITTGVEDLAGNGLEEDYAWSFVTTDVATDTDDDGLIDRDEKNLYGTSPLLEDTDGDGLSDKDEVIGGGTNPLTANVPRLEVDFVGDVTVDILAGVNCGLEKEIITATMNQSQASFTRNAATSTETTISRSQEISTEVSAGFPWSFSASVSASYSAAQSSTSANSSSWQEDSAKTAQQEYQVANSENCFTDTEPDAGTVTMGFKVTNNGTMAFSLDALLLTALYRDPFNPLSLKTLATVDPITETGASTTLAAGTSTGTLTVYANVPTQRARDLLLNPAGLFFEVGTYTITEEGGRNIAWIDNITSARTAVVTIDYGAARQDITNRNVVETHLVATNVERNPDGSSAGVPMSRVMEILGIDYTTEVNASAGKTILASVDGIKYDEPTRQIWMISGSTDDLDQDIPFDDVRIYPRQFINLTLLRDSDYDTGLGEQNDLLFDREEYAFGTNPNSNDTDGDGLNDGYEIKIGWTDLFSGEVVNSSPVVTDSDGDTLNDGDESALGTNPWKADTDHDGILDADDPAPVTPESPSGEVVKVVAGHAHTIAILDDGTLWSWGNNDKGQLGLGDFLEHLKPVQEPSLSTNWIDVDGGESHTLAVKADGTLWAAGWNFSYQLGKTIDTPCPPNSIVSYCSDDFIKVNNEIDWAAVAVGANHSIALKQDGTLWAWGANNQGQLGLGGTSVSEPPTRIGTANDWATIAAGWDHSLATNTSDAVFLWGSRAHGESLGANPLGTLYEAGEASIIGAGGLFSLSLRGEDELLNPGYLYWAGFEYIYADWVFAENDVSAIAAGENHFMFIKFDGSLWGWGSDYYEQLGTGDGDSSNVWDPTTRPIEWQVINQPASEEEKWTSISAGSKHSVGVKADGSLWGWGDNTHGQLGDDTTSVSSTPKRIVAK